MISRSANSAFFSPSQFFNNISATSLVEMAENINSKLARGRKHFEEEYDNNYCWEISSDNAYNDGDNVKISTCTIYFIIFYLYGPYISASSESESSKLVNMTRTIIKNNWCQQQQQYRYYNGY